MPDVLVMERIVTHISLVACFPLDPPSSRRAYLTRSLGKPRITPAQANRLDALGLSHEDLLKLSSESKDAEVFMKVLKDRGVNSKPLREKLVKQLQR